MKVLVTTYYGFGTPIKEAIHELRKCGVDDIVEYPLFRYYCDKHDAKHNYVDHFNEYVTEQAPDIILWWYFGIPTEAMQFIKDHHPKVIFMMFNWDEPANWIPNNVKEKAHLFDCVFITCEETTKRYLQNDTKEAHYILPGYDPQIHKPEFDEVDWAKYNCDISICCTNLYDDYKTYPNQYIFRRIMLDNIYDNQEEYGIKFHVYGPEWLREIYPKSYRWMATYEETNKIFNYSKLSLCTHAICDKNKYFNERFVLIMASGGLLYVDKPKGIEDTINLEEDCVLIDRDNYLEQIKEIINNYDTYKHRRQNGHLKSKQWLWSNWANTIATKMKEIYDNRT